MERNRGPKVTLQSIADELGVSRTTVSNAWNRPNHLSPDLLKAVFDLAERYGYGGPNPTARKLRTGQMSAVGLVFTDALSYAIRDPAAAGFLQGVALACEEANTSLLLIPVNPGGATGLTAIEQAAVDGMVVYSIPEHTQYMKVVESRRVPVVIVDEPDEITGYDWVGPDDRAAFAAVADHLIDLGHRNIAILCHRLTGEENNGPVTDKRLSEATYTVQRKRIDGFLDVVRERLGPRGHVLIEERFLSEIPPGTEAAHAVLDRDPSITAFACTSDALALGALVAAQQRGIAVPEQLSVTGFDGIASAEERGLTTMSQPLVDKGRIAGELLLHPVAGGAPRRRILPTELKVRGTSGPAPRRRR